MLLVEHTEAIEISMGIMLIFVPLHKLKVYG